MSLTAASTVVSAIMAALVAIVLTVLLWRRWPRRGRLALRTGSVLLCQLAVLLAGGLLINQDQNLYPTLDTVLHPPTARTETAVDPSVSSRGLDQWLRDRAAQGARTGLAFPWAPANGGRWPLAERVQVSLPPQYFTEVNSRFPVIVAVAAPGVAAPAGGWADARVAGRAADPAIVVFVRPKQPDAATTALLGADLPLELTRDLRTTPDRWSVVGVGRHGPGAMDLLTRHPERYRSAAAVLPTSAAEVATAAKGHVAAGRPVTLVLPPGAHPPAGMPTPKPSAASAKPQDPLAAGLRWAAAQLPPALDPARTAGEVTQSTPPPSPAAPLPPTTPTPTPTHPAPTPTPTHPPTTTTPLPGPTGRR